MHLLLSLCSPYIVCKYKGKRPACYKTILPRHTHVYNNYYIIVQHFLSQATINLVLALFYLCYESGFIEYVASGLSNSV